MIKLNFLKNKKPESQDLYIQELQKVINDTKSKLSQLEGIQAAIDYSKESTSRVEVYTTSYTSSSLRFNADKEFIEYLEKKQEKLIDELKTIGEIE